jgi:hypothetical protein
VGSTVELLYMVLSRSFVMCGNPPKRAPSYFNIVVFFPQLFIRDDSRPPDSTALSLSH